MHNAGGEYEKDTASLVMGYSAKAQCTGKPLLHALKRGRIGSRREQSAAKKSRSVYAVSLNKGAIEEKSQQIRQTKSTSEHNKPRNGQINSNKRVTEEKKKLAKPYKLNYSIMKLYDTLTACLLVLAENYKSVEGTLKVIETKTTQQTPTSPQQPQPQTPAKRPIGIIILSILGSIGGAYLFYAGLTGLNADLEILTLISHGTEFDPVIKNWMSWAVPLETATMLISFILGIMLLTTIFGLLNGRSWSYKYGIRLPIIAVIISWITLFLFFTAPVFVETGLIGTIIRAIVSVLGASMFILYLQQPHVKNWLNIDTKGQPKTPPKKVEENE